RYWGTLALGRRLRIVRVVCRERLTRRRQGTTGRSTNRVHNRLQGERGRDKCSSDEDLNLHDGDLQAWTDQIDAIRISLPPLSPPGRGAGGEGALHATRPTRVLSTLNPSSRSSRCADKLGLWQIKNDLRSANWRGRSKSRPARFATTNASAS